MADLAASTSGGTTKSMPAMCMPTMKSRKKKHTTIPESAPSRNLRSQTKVTEPNSSSQGSVFLAPETMNPEHNRPLQSEPKAKGKVKKIATQVYRLTSAEIPKNATGIKVCIRQTFEKDES
jgi:hypothetical protein